MAGGWGRCLRSEQLDELVYREVRIPNDSAEQWFFDRPARMNRDHGSRLGFRVDEHQVASFCLSSTNPARLSARITFRAVREGSLAMSYAGTEWGTVTLP